jgi:Domain of Unknown Function (DUF326)
MSYARQMLDAYQHTVAVDAGPLAATIDALTDCAQACVADTDADLGEQNVTEMVTCIRLCLDCADICTTTAAVTSRPSDYDAAVTKPLLESCVAICKSCGDECERHAAMHEHCRICAEACRRCEQACRELLAALKLPGPAGRRRAGRSLRRPDQRTTCISLQIAAPGPAECITDWVIANFVISVDTAEIVCSAVLDCRSA